MEFLDAPALPILNFDVRSLVARWRLGEAAQVAVKHTLGLTLARRHGSLYIVCMPVECPAVSIIIQ